MSGSQNKMGKSTMMRLKEFTGLQLDEFMEMEDGQVKTIRVDPYTVAKMKNGIPDGDRQKELNRKFMNEYGEVFDGMKRKIAYRLAPSHSQQYIDEILGYVNDIIIEASIFGVECKRYGIDEVIVRSVNQRRAYDTLVKHG